MKARAIQRNIHVSPRKAGLVCDLIRGLPVAKALVILDNTNQKSAKIIKKILNSAIANATNNHAMVGEKLYIYQIAANQGSSIKRTLPRAKGSADMIKKRHTHLEIILSDDPQEHAKDLIAIKAKKAKKIPSKKAKVNKPVEKPAVVKPKIKLQQEVAKEPEIKKEGVNK